MKYVNVKYDEFLFSKKRGLEMEVPRSLLIECILHNGHLHMEVKTVAHE